MRREKAGQWRAGTFKICFCLAILTNYHRPCGLDSGHLFLPVLGAGGKKQCGQVLGVGRLPGSHLSSRLLAVSSHGGKGAS